MRRIIVEAKDNDTQSLSNIKLDILRLDRKIADLKVVLDDTKKSNQADDKKKKAVDSIEAQLKSLRADIDSKRKSLKGIQNSIDMKKGEVAKESIGSKVIEWL